MLLVLGEILLVIQPQVAGACKRADLLSVLGTHLTAPNLINSIPHHFDDVELIDRCLCERGTNENHNGIIRRFLPKGVDFACIKEMRISKIQHWMNSYPRKTLNGLTPGSP